MKKLYFGIIFLISFHLVIDSNAQTDSCITYLKTANSNYEQRDFDGAIKLLQTALLRCNLDRSDEIQAHKLLALSYLAIDNLETADKEAETIIKIEPNYSADKFKDDPKYSALFEKFRPVPVFRVGFMVGANRVFTSVDNYYSIVHDDAVASQYSTYNDKYGFQLGLSAEYRAIKNFWIELQGQFRKSKYEHILTEVEGTTVNYSEVLSYIDAPLSIKYYFIEKDISPYIEGGATFSFLTNALGTTTRDDVKDLVNRTDYRNTFMVGYFAGIGGAFKIKSFNLFANIRYTIFNDNVNKEGTLYSDPINVFKYYYIDDDFSMNNLQFSIGGSYTLSYNNRKVQ
jgi:hypothetical protein